MPLVETKKLFPLGKASWAVLLLAGALVWGLPAAAEEPAQPQARPQKKPQPETARQASPAGIDRTGVVILIKSALIALDQANKTGNYTVLRDLGSQSFQANTAARLAEIFAAQRNQRIDLSGVFVLDPQLTLLPQIEPNGMLHMRGFFPSAPKQVNFDLQWEPEDRQWKIFGLGINIADSSPLAPDSPATPPRTSEKTRPPVAPTGAVVADPPPAK